VFNVQLPVSHSLSLSPSPLLSLPRSPCLFPATAVEPSHLVGFNSSLSQSISLSLSRPLSLPLSRSPSLSLRPPRRGRRIWAAQSAGGGGSTPFVELPLPSSLRVSHGPRPLSGVPSLRLVVSDFQWVVFFSPP
jgi:hypothetical protein